MLAEESCIQHYGNEFMSIISVISEPISSSVEP